MNIENINKSYVYFISNGLHTKIGKSNNVNKRLKLLSTAASISLILLGTIECESEIIALDLEKKLHIDNEDNRLNGEWFSLSFEDMYSIPGFTAISNNTGSRYFGPRKYWRTMELYDKAQLLLGSKVGIQLMIYFKLKVNISNYRITINNTWLAEDLNISRDAIIKNLKKLANAGYIIKEPRGKYFISPSMFWIDKMPDDIWQEHKQAFNDKLKELGIVEP